MRTQGHHEDQLFDIVIPELMNATDLLKLNASVVMDVILHKVFPCD